MLTLEQQVTSLELSKKLSEFGVRKNGLFYWTQCPFEDNYYISDIVKSRAKDIYFSAYTAAELLAVLQNFDTDWYFQITIEKDEFCIAYRGKREWPVSMYCMNNINLAEAAGNMLAFFIENDHITLAEINKEAE